MVLTVSWYTAEPTSHGSTAKGCQRLARSWTRAPTRTRLMVTIRGKATFRGHMQPAEGKLPADSRT